MHMALYYQVATFHFVFIIYIFLAGYLFVASVIYIIQLSIIVLVVFFGGFFCLLAKCTFQVNCT